MRTLETLTLTDFVEGDFLILEACPNLRLTVEAHASLSRPSRRYSPDLEELTITRVSVADESTGLELPLKFGDSPEEKILKDSLETELQNRAVEEARRSDEWLASTEDCALCNGTGIGQHGDPSTSRCYACNGRGYIEIDSEED